MDEIEWRATTSGGPGGQHANRTSSRVEVRFDVDGSRTLGPRQRARLRERFGPVVRAGASDDRSQARNRQARAGAAGRPARRRRCGSTRPAGRPGRRWARRSAGSRRSGSVRRSSGSGGRATTTDRDDEVRSPDAPVGGQPRLVCSIETASRTSSSAPDSVSSRTPRSAVSDGEAGGDEGGVVLGVLTFDAAERGDRGAEGEPDLTLLGIAAPPGTTLGRRRALRGGLDDPGRADPTAPDAAELVRRHGRARSG